MTVLVISIVPHCVNQSVVERRDPTRTKQIVGSLCLDLCVTSCIICYILIPKGTSPRMVNHSVSWPLQVEMEAEGRMKDLVGDIMRLLVEIGSLKDGKPALSPLDLDNLEGTLREVKERNRQLREECGQMQLSRRRERERAR